MAYADNYCNGHNDNDDWLLIASSSWGRGGGGGGGSTNPQFNVEVVNERKLAGMISKKIKTHRFL